MGSMLNLQTTGGADVTMSSREIAELTGRRHDQVLRTARELVEQGVTQSVETLYRHEQNGVEYPEHRLGKRDSLVLVARLSPEFTGRIVDRWMELEESAPHDPLASLPPEQRALVSLMLDNAAMKQVQAQHSAAIARIEQRVEESAQAQLMLARPANAEATVHIRERINKLYGLPPRIIDTVLRQSLYAPKPAGMVKNTREEARGASYAVYWTKDITALFARFASECERVTDTLATHPLILGRFKLTAHEVGHA